jgi:hypothetical protein
MGNSVESFAAHINFYFTLAYDVKFIAEKASLSKLLNKQVIKCKTHSRWTDRNKDINNNNSIQFNSFNSILYYLCAEPTATRPITGTAQCRYR